MHQLQNGELRGILDIFSRTKQANAVKGIIGASAVSKCLTQFLPNPRTEKTDSSRTVNYGVEKSIGKVAQFFVVAPNVVRACLWVMTLGADGLPQVEEIVALNNDDLLTRTRQIPGHSTQRATGKQDLEQACYTR